MTGDGLKRLVEALERHGCRGRGKSWQCPAHEDRAPSLSIDQGDKGAILECKAGCATKDVVSVLGLALPDLFDVPLNERRDRPQVVAEYPYTDEQGEVLFVVRRIEPGYDRERKTFRQYRPDGTAGTKGIRRVLYRLPEVAAEAQAGGTVFVCEGEKDADNLRTQAGVVATCNVMGAGKWSDTYTASLRGASEVVVIADRDEPGRRHAAAVAESVKRAGIPVRILEPAKGKDVSDHLAAGLGYSELVTPEWHPTNPRNEGASQDAGAGPNSGTSGTQKEEEAPGRRLRITPLSSIRLRATYWTWQDRIPVSGLTLWAGREGIGKSTSAAWLVAQITRGTLPGINHGKPRSVFYAASEDSWERTVAPRLVAAGADLERTFRIDVIQDDRPGISAPLTLPADTSTLGKEMLRYDVGLLVVDPLVSALNGSIDTHRDREVRSALEPLGQIADQASAAVLGLVHFGKGASTDPLSLILGSRAFAATARAVICMARDPESEDGTVILSQEKNNLGRLDLPSLTYVVQSAVIETEDGPSFVGRCHFTGESERSVGDMLAEGATSTGGNKDERDEAARWLRDFMLSKNGGEAPAAEVLRSAEKDGLSKDAVKRAKKKVGVSSEKSSFGAGWVWRYNPGSDTHGNQVPRPDDEGSTEPPQGSEERRTQSAAPFAPFVPPSGKVPYGRSRIVVEYSDRMCDVCGSPLNIVEADACALTHARCLPADRVNTPCAKCGKPQWNAAGLPHCGPCHLNRKPRIDD